MSLSYVKKNARKLLSFLAFGSFETLDSKLSHGTSQKVADVRHHLRKVSKENFVFNKKAPAKLRLYFMIK